MAMPSHWRKGNLRTQWNMEILTVWGRVISRERERKSAKRVRELLKHVNRLSTGKNRTKHIWQAWELSETFEQTLQRQQQDRVHKASIRATGTPSEVMQRKQSNKEHISNEQRKSVSAFHSEVRFGPDFVCTFKKVLSPVPELLLMCFKGYLVMTSATLWHGVIIWV